MAVVLTDGSAKREILLRCMIDVLCHYAIKYRYALTLFGKITCNPRRGLILDNADFLDRVVYTGYRMFTVEVH